MGFRQSLTPGFGIGAAFGRFDMEFQSVGRFKNDRNQIQTVQRTAGHHADDTEGEIQRHKPKASQTLDMRLAGHEVFEVKRYEIGCVLKLARMVGAGCEGGHIAGVRFPAG